MLSRVGHDILRKERYPHMPKAEGVGVRNFFIGSNTAEGFVSYTEEIFGGLKKVHIIKGGPGTGKSTLMKRIALAAEDRGYTVERYYCSSDSESLDGIVIPVLAVGFADGTSPHVMEAKYPGVKESLLDLGALWNTEMLEPEGKVIRSLTEEKSSHFASVYRSLALVSALRSEYRAGLGRCFDEKKADAAVGRLIKRLGKGAGFSMSSRQISALGMNGRTVFNSYSELADERWLISDTRGLASDLLRLLVTHARGAGLAVWASRDPLGGLDALYFPERGLAVTTAGDAETAAKIINTERFIIKERLSVERGRLRFLAKLERELMARVEDTFAAIRRAHFSLEQIYSRAMDFAALDALTGRVIEGLVGG